MRGRRKHEIMAVIEYSFHFSPLKTFVRVESFRCIQRIRAFLCTSVEAPYSSVITFDHCFYFGKICCDVSDDISQLRGKCHVSKNIACRAVNWFRVRIMKKIFAALKWLPKIYNPVFFPQKFQWLIEISVPSIALILLTKRCDVGAHTSSIILLRFRSRVLKTKSNFTSKRFIYLQQRMFAWKKCSLIEFFCFFWA